MMLNVDDQSVRPLNLKDPKLLSAVLEAANDAIVITEAECTASPHPRIVYVNESYTRMSGYSLHEVFGQSPRILQGPETCRTTLDRIKRQLKAWQPFREEVLNYRKDGTPFWVELNVRPLADETGWFTHWVAVQRDVTERRLAMEALGRHARDLEEAQRQAKLGTWRLPLDELNATISSEMARIMSLPSNAEAISVLRLIRSLDTQDLRKARQAIRKIHQLGEIATFEVQVHSDSGTPRSLWVEGRPEHDMNGAIIAARGLCQDVTERRTIEDKLLWNATHDKLTGLLNIEGLRTEAYPVLARACSIKRPVIVGLIDLDHLKLVNDTLGHAVGDALIVEVAERLRKFFGHQSCVARLGGDEFVFVEYSKFNDDELCARLHDLVGLLNQPHEYQGRLLDCGGSVGVVVSHGTEPSLDDLLRNADLAMYRAKEVGRGGFIFFSSDLQAGIERKVAHLDLARQALSSRLILPHFQPKINLETGQLVGFEALLRLEKDGEILPPSAIEHAFENLDLATRLGDEMLHRVLSQIRSWDQHGFQYGSVALNVSGPELLRAGYAERVLQALSQANVRAAAIEIEVTEGVLVGRGAERVASAIGQLREAGVRIVLDDFGTGYASLTHLKSLPISGIKIDKSFVSDMLEDESDASIVRALIGLAEALSIDLVAEGVETQAQADFLRICKCKMAQGYLFGQAVPADKCTSFPI